MSNVTRASTRLLLRQTLDDIQRVDEAIEAANNARALLRVAHRRLARLEAELQEAASTGDGMAEPEGPP